MTTAERTEYRPAAARCRCGNTWRVHVSPEYRTIYASSTVEDQATECSAAHGPLATVLDDRPVSDEALAEHWEQTDLDVQATREHAALLREASTTPWLDAGKRQQYRDRLAEVESRQATVYASIEDVVTREVVPALGDHVGDFDVEAIARELFEWHTERTEQGDILVNRSGYRMRADIEFWTVAGGYERTDATETP